MVRQNEGHVPDFDRVDISALEGHLGEFDKVEVDLLKGYAKLSPWNVELEAGGIPCGGAWAPWRNVHTNNATLSTHQTVQPDPNPPAMDFQLSWPAQVCMVYVHTGR